MPGNSQAHPVPPILKPYVAKNSIVTRSPGRINLIGEHTDYNNGFVLPAAIDKAAYLVMTPRADGVIHLRAADMDEVYSTSVSRLEKATHTAWPNYMLGVVQQFLDAGVSVAGFDATLSADIPVGAGLSSSAAVECAVALALNKLSGAGLDKLSLVRLAQKAENEYVGVQCGIMDQFASMFGKKDYVIRLDCRSLAYTYVPFNMGGIKIVLLDTNVKHSLGSSAYNDRRAQCETGVAWMRAQDNSVNSLRDATMDMLNAWVLPRDPLIYQRCRYVVEENGRLLAACDDLEAGDLPAFGRKMYATHEGLSRDYEVSCPEADFLVDAVKLLPTVLGARMMGGGFGGCTINLVEEGAVEEMIRSCRDAYRKKMNRQLKAYIANIESGSSVIA